MKHPCIVSTTPLKKRPYPGEASREISRQKAEGQQQLGSRIRHHRAFMKFRDATFENTNQRKKLVDMECRTGSDCRYRYEYCCFSGERNGKYTVDRAYFAAKN